MSDFEVRANRSEIAALWAADGPLAAVLRDMGSVVADGQRRRAAVRTGAMRASVTVAPVEHDSGGGLSVDVGPTARSPRGFPYPLAVEFGVPSRNIPAQPFVRPSLDDLR